MGPYLCLLASAPRDPVQGKKEADGLMGGFHSQDVTDDPDAPHVSGQTYRLVINHLRCHKLWRPVHHLKRCGVIWKHIMCIKCQTIVE